MIVASNIQIPGLPLRVPAPVQPRTLRSNGTGVIHLTTVKNPRRSCRLLLLETGKTPLDISHLVTHRAIDGEAGQIAFDLMVTTPEQSFAPGLYQLEYAVGNEVDGRLKLIVPDSALNPRSPLYTQDTSAGQWEWVRIVDVPMNGQTSVQVEIPSEFNNLSGGMGFSVRLNGVEDPDSFARVVSRTAMTLELTCSPLKAGHVIRCIFY